MEEFNPSPLPLFQWNPFGIQTVTHQATQMTPLLPYGTGESWMSILNRNWDIPPIPPSILHESQSQPMVPRLQKKNFWEGVKEFFNPIINGIGKVIGFIKTVVKIVANVASIVSVTKHLFA